MKKLMRIIHFAFYTVIFHFDFYILHLLHNIDSSSLAEMTDREGILH